MTPFALIDAGGASQTDQQRLWPFDLAKDAGAEYTAWVKLPDVPVTVQASVDSGSGDYKTQQTLALTIDPIVTDDLQAALNAMAPLTAASYKQPRSALQQAESQRLASNWPAALDALRNAADRLSAIDSPLAASIRLRADRALRSVSIKTVAP